MKHILLVVVLAAMGTAVLSQNFDKMVISKNLGDGGILYFVRPEDGFHAKNVKCSYDQTVISNRDSVRIGMSLFTQAAFRIDSVEAFCDGEVVGKVFRAELGFVEPCGSRWTCRAFITLTKDEVKSFFALSRPPALCMYMGAQSLTLTVKPSRWKKIQRLNLLIYNELMSMYR